MTGRRTPWDHLSARELAVLTLAADGLDVKETAAELRVAPSTVKAHRKRLLFALDATNVTHAVAIAYHRGILIVPRTEAA